jgi:hypothetical protein
MSNVQYIDRINNKRQLEKELVTGWRQLQLQHKNVLLKQPANLKEVQSFHMSNIVSSWQLKN